MPLYKNIGTIATDLNQSLNPDLSYTLTDLTGSTAIPGSGGGPAVLYPSDPLAGGGGAVTANGSPVNSPVVPIVPAPSPAPAGSPNILSILASGQDQGNIGWIAIASAAVLLLASQQSGGKTVGKDWLLPGAAIAGLLVMWGKKNKQAAQASVSVQPVA